MNKIFPILILFVLWGCSDSGRRESSSGDIVSDVLVSDTIGVADKGLTEMGIPVSDYDMKEGVVKPNEFFSNLIYSLGVDQLKLNLLLKESEKIFDVRKIRAGNQYRAYYTTDDTPQLAYLVYEKDKTSHVVFRLIDTVSVSIKDKEVVSSMKYAEVTINSSLWMDTKQAGINPVLALKLSDIYAWSIDFFGLRRGDSFQVLYEELSIGNKEFEVGDIYAAFFMHGGKEYVAYRFTQSGITQYWNDIGESLKKAFLKAPLNYTRVSSGFTYARRHPITRIVRPHTGVDYAAPAGTPVVSIGDGVVTMKRYAGGGGNTIKIKHNSVYMSAYLHLSRYGKGVSEGGRVRQGQVIGYVGSTGMSTGPHLDFRIWKNGKPIDPLHVQSPPAEPISKENKKTFEEYKKTARNRIDSLKSVIYVDSLMMVLKGKQI